MNGRIHFKGDRKSRAFLEVGIYLPSCLCSIVMDYTQDTANERRVKRYRRKLSILYTGRENTKALYNAISHRLLNLNDLRSRHHLTTEMIRVHYNLNGYKKSITECNDKMYSAIRDVDNDIYSASNL